jgi:hypothetical protein
MTPWAITSALSDYAGLVRCATSRCSPGGGSWVHPCLGGLATPLVLGLLARMAEGHAAGQLQQGLDPRLRAPQPCHEVRNPRRVLPRPATRAASLGPSLRWLDIQIHKLGIINRIYKGIERHVSMAGRG